ncbi:RNA polymerase-associated protein RTF1 homolog [Drosophila albomicans]|uniref:RNA polymerase-associated protein RTF1 homolog n=1 Tax=Drosophila albomicans TaxID=7291 RepID=A0A6P8WS11_DROAB|nr:RNA polymerase-associated protein RTF1 homolog [Drosophila albomicans]
MSEAKAKRTSKSTRNSPRFFEADELASLMQPLQLLQARTQTQKHRPKSEILRELRRLRATPISLDDEEKEKEREKKAQQTGINVKPLRTLEQLDALRLTRHRIKQLLGCSSFDQVVSNCFVRLNVSAPNAPPEYRIAEIVLVEQLPEGYYVDKLATNIALHLRYEDLVQRHELNDISNMAFTSEEFELWRDNCICQAIEWPTTELVARKKIELYNALNSEGNKLPTMMLHKNGLLTTVMPMRPMPRGGLLERFGGKYPWKLQRPSPKEELNASDDAADASGNRVVELEAINKELELQRKAKLG